MVQLAFFIEAVLFFSLFSTTMATSLGLVARQAIDPSSLPPACQSSCQVINTMYNCGYELSCLCTSSVGSELQQCMNCLVSSDPTIESEAQSAIDGWNQSCSGNLSLGGSSSGGSTGGVPSTSTPSSTGSGSSTNPLTGGNLGGAISLKTSGTAICVAAAFAGAFMSF